MESLHLSVWPAKVPLPLQLTGQCTLWCQATSPFQRNACADESEEDDVDPERCLPEAKRRKLMKRRGGRRVADTEVVSFL